MKIIIIVGLIFLVLLFAGCIEKELNQQTFQQTHTLNGFFSHWESNEWGKGGYNLYFNDAMIDEEIVHTRSNHTLHWFLDIDDYVLNDFVGQNVIIEYYNDLNSNSIEWNGNEISVIKNLTKGDM